MSPRASGELLFVGSLPFATEEEALRTTAEVFGDVVFALPDGEPGPRSMWVAYEMSHLFEPHPDIEVAQRPSSPDGIPRHIYDLSTYRVRAGVSELHFERWPRIDDAISSYRLFRSLRDEGAIPPGVRFQVCLPLTASAITGAFQHNFAADYPVVQRAFEDLAERELHRLFTEIPAEDVALQWDIAFEPLDLEGVLPWTVHEEAWDRYLEPIGRLSPHIPAAALVGYHLCYGTFPQWPMYEARDMDLIVRMANAARQHAGRTVDWFHLAGPRHLRSEEDAFFEPLRDLDRGDAAVYLGIVLQLDGADGVRKRAATASRHLDDFGVALYCGFGRQPGEDGRTTLQDHRAALDAFRRWREGVPEPA